MINMCCNGQCNNRQPLALRLLGVNALAAAALLMAHCRLPQTHLGTLNQLELRPSAAGSHPQRLWCRQRCLPCSGGIEQRPCSCGGPGGLPACNPLQNPLCPSPVPLTNSFIRGPDLYTSSSSVTNVGTDTLVEWTYKMFSSHAIDSKAKGCRIPVQLRSIAQTWISRLSSRNDQDSRN